MLFQVPSPDNDAVVPISGLSQGLHLTVFLLAALFGSIITAKLFPRLICPAFMKLKKLMAKSYNNGYIPNDNASVGKKYLFRGINIALLTLGFMAFIIPLIYAPNWIPGGEVGYNYYVHLGIPPEYVMTILTAIMCITLPFSVGLWAVSWQLEDSGLMHYSFDNKKIAPLYEIEPIHVNYSSYLKGFAGISTVLFIIQIAIAWASITTESRISDVISTIMLPFSIMAMAIPSYIVYCKFSAKSDFLKKGLPEINILKESDIVKQ